MQDVQCVLWSLRKYIMSGPKLSTWIPGALQWPCMNQSLPYPFSPSQCHHKTWHMSETVRHNHVRAAQIKHARALKSLYAQANKRKDSQGCLTNESTHLLPLVLLNIAADVDSDQCCLCVCVFDEELRRQLKHQIILLLSGNSWGASQPWRFLDLNEFNIKYFERRLFIVVIV